jgi:hypothetical protein
MLVIPKKNFLRPFICFKYRGLHRYERLIGKKFLILFLFIHEIFLSNADYIASNYELYVSEEL